MANIKSAKKRILVIEKKTLQNKMLKSALKTAIKKVTTDNTVETAKENLVNAVKKLDQSVAKGILHKNNAARKKSKLTKMINKMA